MSNRNTQSRMVNRLKPLKRRWYECVDTGDLFEVIAVDEIDGIVDVQNFSGEVAEMNMATWRKLRLVRVVAPQWSEDDPLYGDDQEHDYDVAEANRAWTQWHHGSRAMH